MWAGTSAFELAGRALAIRFTSAEVQAEVDEILGSHRCERMPSTVTYAVRSEPVGRGPDVHVLFWGSTPMARARDVGRVVDAIGGHLAAYGAWSPGAMIIDGAAVAAGDEAVLFPSSLRPALVAIERRISRWGGRLVDSPWAEVDPETGHLLVVKPLGRDQFEPVRVRLAIRRWVVGDQEPVSPGEVLIAASELVVQPDRRAAGERLSSARTLMNRVPLGMLAATPAAKLSSAVEGLFRS